MLAARDQENLVHTHQTTAAGKPLNQGIRTLQPKTPGPSKTPFRTARNDENKPIGFNGQKTVGRGGDSKLNKNAFITPIGPRTRAPLGVKTTNAKGQAFKTPAPPQQTVKPQKTVPRPSTARRSAKSKIIVAPTQPVETDILATEQDDDVPDIEYAPPPPIELPDPPMEFGYDQNFPQFQGENMFLGYDEVYGSPKDENGVSIRLKQEQEDYEQYKRDTDRAILKVLDNLPHPSDPDREVEAMIAAGPRRKITDSKVDTIRARSAATALSQSDRPSGVLKETASSLQKKKKPAFAVLGPKPSPIPTNPSPMRHVAAAAVSRNTIGYPKAARPRSIIPMKEQRSKENIELKTAKKIDQNSIHPKRFLELYGEPPVESEMWFRLRENERSERLLKQDDGDDLADNLFSTDFFPVGGDDDDDDELFQLPMPE